MPVVHVNVWEGFGEEKAKTVIQNITKVFVDLGIPSHAVEVIVHEIQKLQSGGWRRTSIREVQGYSSLSV
jgi:4-oxalocrotonate tautomerase